ncbi:MAG: lytic murein transglycosylase [Proteobacteria bacterium]|nr:lytic murein transglycosylase [Pseudomonadota bacterium]
MRRKSGVAVCALMCTLVLAAGAMVPAPPASAETGYQHFVKHFWASARKAGVSRKIYDAAFAGLTPDPEVIRKNAFQPEFKLPAAHYLTLVVTDTRVRLGKERLAQYSEQLGAIEKRWGVDRHVLLAIWGMETSYGAFMGKMNVIRSLSTLAYKGRRARFGRNQRCDKLRMMQRGVVPVRKAMILAEVGVFRTLEASVLHRSEVIIVVPASSPQLIEHVAECDW